MRGSFLGDPGPFCGTMSSLRFQSLGRMENGPDIFHIVHTRSTARSGKNCNISRWIPSHPVAFNASAFSRTRLRYPLKESGPVKRLGCCLDARWCLHVGLGRWAAAVSLSLCPALTSLTSTDFYLCADCSRNLRVGLFLQRLLPCSAWGPSSSFDIETRLYF